MKSRSIPTFLSASLFLPLALLASPAFAQTVGVASSAIEIDADAVTGIFGIETASSYSPPSASLMYNLLGPGSTSTITAMVNGSTADFSTAPVISPLAAVGSGLGAYLETTRSVGAGVNLKAHYEIAKNPVTGIQPDTAMLQFTFTNTGAMPATIGLKVEIDTMVNGVDGANISLNNGGSVILNDTLYRKNAGTIPPEWWDYDIPPPGTPNLIGHGALYNNPFGTTATQPDAFEVAEWPTVGGGWLTGSVGSTIDDSSVVIWWTGTGDESNGSIVLNPGQSITFTTYYGISQLALLVTPSPTNTPTATNPAGTPTNTPTRTNTGTPTNTPTPTFTPTPFPTVVDVFYVNKNIFTPSSGESVSIYVNYSRAPGNYGLIIYNSVGEHIKTVVEPSTITQYVDKSYFWDGTNKKGDPCASGMYILYLIEPFDRKLKRVLLVR
ncbi:MAG TPA: hypothetical protein VMV05_11455 [bacterium]|nr:hypothetical protein [bacterium]